MSKIPKVVIGLNFHEYIISCSTGFYPRSTLLPEICSLQLHPIFHEKIAFFPVCFPPLFPHSLPLAATPAPADIDCFSVHRNDSTKLHNGYFKKKRLLPE